MIVGILAASLLYDSTMKSSLNEDRFEHTDEHFSSYVAGAILVSAYLTSVLTSASVAFDNCTSIR